MQQDTGGTLELHSSIIFAHPADWVLAETRRMQRGPHPDRDAGLSRCRPAALYAWDRGVLRLGVELDALVLLVVVHHLGQEDVEGLGTALLQKLVS